jgi:hypothetical protein
VLREIAVIAGLSLLLTGCGAQSSSQDAQGSPTAAPSVSSAAPVSTVAEDFPADEPPPDLTIGTTDACETADLLYQSLDKDTRAYVSAGVQAEANGDAEGVRSALEDLHPFLTSVSRTFQDTAGKVQDPQMKDALTQLSGAAAKEATFTSFAEFKSLAALVTPAETILKAKCAEAGYQLVNIQ